MVATQKFWDKHAAGYAKSPVRNEESYQKKLQITRSYLSPESVVFEFGCGTGTTSVHHAPFAKSILAIDISEKMLEIARDRAREKNVENIEFRQGSIEDFEEQDGSFDLVMGHSILHLLRDPQGAIDKVYRLLKPGGVFVSSTVCLGNRISLWRLILPPLSLVGIIPYVQVMSRQALENYFSNAGFDIDFQWEQRKKEAAFIIVRKPAV